MEAAAVSASHGVMLSLPSKLDSLLLLQPSLRKGEKKKILLLKGDLQHLLDDYYLVDPSPSNYAAPPEPEPELDLTASAACWAKEVRELSYDVDDFIDELTTQLILLHRDGHGSRKTSVIARLRGELNRRRWVADEATLLSARVNEAIRRHERYDLGGYRPIESAGDERGRFLSLTFGMDMDDDAVLHGRLIGRDDSSTKRLLRWLADNGEGERNKLDQVASIVGFGGVGKTTLATEIYRLRLEDRFDCRAFVRTSWKPEIAKILADMLSQLRQPQQHQHQSSPEDIIWEVDRLIETIRAHLQDKKYFIIIEDLWASSTWDIIRRGLPENNHCSRILITTEIESVALACCGYNSKYIFKIDPLNEDVSRKLFFSRVVGEGNEFPGQLAQVSYDIIRKCGGLPLAITITARYLKSQLDRMLEWNHVRNSLTSDLKKNPTLQGMRQVLNLIYNKLPHCLKACMLYLSIYKEDYIIRKANLVKQWMADGFINSTDNEDMEKVAGNYFDELVSRGLIQPVDINCKNEVLSCAVHHMVLNFIRCKSIEENFSITLDHSKKTIRHADKVRRLFLHFGNAHDTTPLAGLRLSQVRSMAYFGQVKCMPSIAEYRLLRVLILHFWADQDERISDLTSISELLRLKYLKITGNITAKLPEQIQGLRHLQTLEVDARATAVPFDIVHTLCLLHLRLVLLERLPHSHPHMYIFTSIPKWTGKLNKLRMLNIAVMQISQDDLDILKELGSLTALMLLVRTAPAQRIVVANEGFMALKYFMFVCTAPCVAFVEGAMSTVQRLTLRFNANELKQYGSVEPGFEHLVALEEISARIGATDGDASNKMEVESALRTAIRKHPSTLMVDIQWVDWIFGVEGRDLDEDSVKLNHNGFCMLPESSSRLQNREIDIEEDMPSGTEGMVIVCHTMDQFVLHMSQAKESHKLVVIQFTSPSCPASGYIAPAFTEYAKEFAGAVFIKVNVDSYEMKSVTDSYDIKGIVPTFFFVKDGKKIDKIPGANKDLLRAKIRRHIASPHFLR